MVPTAQSAWAKTLSDLTFHTRRRFRCLELESILERPRLARIGRKLFAT